VRLQETVDFVATDGATVILEESAENNDILQITRYSKFLGNGDNTVDTFTVASNAYQFTLSVAPASEANTAIYVDGVYQNKTSYSLSGTTLDFGSGNSPGNGAIVEAIIFSSQISAENPLSELNVAGNSVLGTAGSATVSGTAIKDEDNMASNSASHLATQQSIKAYVDTQIATEDTLAELNDTNITTPADASVLLYDTGTSTWRDAAMSGDVTITDTGVTTVATLNQNTTGTAATVTGAAQTAITSVGTLTSLNVDSLSLNDSTISDPSTLTVDAGGQIVLDADGGLIQFKDGGTEIAQLKNSSSDFQIISIVADKDMIFRGNDNGSYFNALTLDMSDAGHASFNNHITAAGNIYTAGNVNLTVDGKKIRLGAGEDLQLYHDGSNSYINDTGTGALFLKTNYLAVAGANGNQLINAEQGAAVELYHNNSKKVETSSTGVTVTGIAVATSFTGNLTGDLLGTPNAPTAAANTNTTQVATTAYVQTELTDLINGAPGTLDTLNELAAAINDDANYNSTLTTALATKAPLASPTFTGIPLLSNRLKTQDGSDQLNIGQWDGTNHRIEGDANRPIKIYSYNTTSGIALGISGSDKLTILGNGSGISVAGGITATGGLAGTTGTFSGVGTFAGVLTGNRFINATNSSDPWLKGVNTSGTETSYIQQSGNAFFAGTATAAAFTTSSSAALQATFNTSTTSGGYIQWQVGSAAKFYIGSSGSVGGSNDNNYDLYAVAGKGLRFFTNASLNMTIESDGDVKVGPLAVSSATSAPLHVAKAGTDVQAIFGDNANSIDDPSIRIIGRDTANSAIRYAFFGLDADANHGFIGYNAGTGGFVNALNFDTSGITTLNTSAIIKSLGTNNVPADLSFWHIDSSIVSGDDIAVISAEGTDQGGSPPYQGGKITFDADADWDTGTSNYYPTNINFFTQDNSGTDTIAAGPRMIIQADGNVGIGTTSPATQLQVAGTGILTLGISGVANGTITSPHSLILKTVGAGEFLRYYQAGTEVFGVYASGKVGIGTATPNSILHLGAANNSNHEAILTLNNGGATGNEAGIEWLYEASTTPRAKIFLNASSQDLTIDAGGWIALDAADGGHVRFKDGGTQYASIYESSSNAIIDSTGSFTIDAVGDIILDADGADITLKDGGVEFGHLSNSSGLLIQSAASNSHINLTPAGTGNVNINSDTLTVVGTEGESATLMLQADEADDNADIWGIRNNTDNTLTFINQISGSLVPQITLTPHATVASSVTAIVGKATVGGDLTVGNSYISSNYSQFANLRVDNNAYMGTENTPQAVQILAGGGVNFNYPVEMYGHVAIGSAADNATIDNNFTTGGLDVAVGSGTKAFQIWDDNSTGTPRFAILRDGKVGIGTAAPAYPFTIELDQSVDWLSRIYNTGTTETDNGVLIRTGSEHDGTITLAAYSGLSYKFVVRGDGNIGIGTTAPATELQIGDYTDNAETLTFATASDQTGRINFYNHNASEGASMRVTGGGLGAKMIFANRYTTDTDRVAFDLVNGRVGIGETSPSAQLHMKHASGPTLMMTRTSTNTSGSIGEIIFGNADWDSSMASIRAIQDGGNDSGKLEFKTQASAAGGEVTRLTIFSTGLSTFTGPASQVNLGGGATSSSALYVNATSGHVGELVQIIDKNNVERLQITNDGRGLSDFTVRAWVNFNGTGTVAARDSHNVSSVTDHATGDYTVNFTNTMPSANYASAVNTGMGTSVNSATGRMSASSHLAASFRIGVRSTIDQAWIDEDFVSGIFVGG
jgi:hypothetical protein